MIFTALEKGSFPFNIQYAVKFAGDTKLKVVSNTAEDRSKNQIILTSWKTNKKKCNRSKYKVLYLAMDKDFLNRI